MQGRHLKKRGRYWHYYRNRPKRFSDVERQSVITFSLRTSCISEAKLKAAQISHDLDQKWETALNRGVSLNSSDNRARFEAAVATNLTHGFSRAVSTSFTDQELLTRLRYLLEKQITPSEGAAVLGLVEKPSLSLEGAFERFWLHIEDEWTGYSHDQIRGKRNVYLRSMRNFEKAVGTISLYDLKRSHALEFRNWWLQRIKENGLKNYTANREISCLRRLFKVNFDIDDCEDKNPFARIRLKSEPDARRSPLKSEQIEALLLPGKLDGLQPEFQILLKLVINTGMRPVEGIGLELNDIHLDHDVPYVHVRANNIRVLKTPQSDRIIPLVGISLNAAVQLVDRGGWGKKAGKNMYATSVINRHLKAMNAFEGVNQSFYSLRHWFQDQLTQLGVVDRIQCQLMGHKFNRPTYGDGAPLEMLRDVIAKFAL